MTIPFLCLAGFALWTMALVILGVLWRLPLVLRGDFTFRGFPSGVEHGPDRYWRVHRAHVNALEVLPLFAVAVLVAHLSGARVPGLELAAQLVLGARVVQSVVHIAANTTLSVSVRLGAWVVQVVSIGWILLAALTNAGQGGTSSVSGA